MTDANAAMTAAIGAGRQQLRDQDRQRPLHAVEHHRQHRGAYACRAQHIRRADVAAARLDADRSRAAATAGRQMGSSPRGTRR